MESPNAALLNEFVQKARAGTHIGTAEIQRFARLFKVRHLGWFNQASFVVCRVVKGWW